MSEQTKSPNEIATELLEGLEGVMDVNWALNNNLLICQEVASHIKRSLKPNIEALATSHQRLVEALENIEQKWVSNPSTSDDDDFNDGYESGLLECMEIAREALATAKGGAS